jgi:hypothetical protein
VKPSWVALSIAWVTAAHAMGPPAMIHTKDGSVYYGELVERVETKGDEHVTILLATGVPKRIALKDVDPSPVSLPVMPREEHTVPTVTVRTLNGSAYHGELVERVAGEHVILKLDTGDMKTIDWADIDQSPPPPPRSAPHEDAPVENVRTKNGSIYHGEIIEKVMRDHVTIKLATDEVKTIEWQDIALTETAPTVTSRARTTTLVVNADDGNAVLERLDADGIFTAVCHAPCEETSPMGTYRVTGPGLVPTPPFQTSGNTHVFATMTSSTTKTAAVVTSASGGGLLFTGFLLLLADLGTSSYASDKSGLDWATGTIMTMGSLTFLVGMSLLAVAKSDVKLSRAPTEWASRW